MAIMSEYAKLPPEDKTKLDSSLEKLISDFGAQAVKSSLNELIGSPIIAGSFDNLVRAHVSVPDGQPLIPKIDMPKRRMVTSDPDEYLEPTRPRKRRG